LGLACEFLASADFPALTAKITPKLTLGFPLPDNEEWLLQQSRTAWEVLDLFGKEKQSDDYD
jgi:hypothetical protein